MIIMLFCVGFSNFVIEEGRSLESWRRSWNFVKIRIRGSGCYKFSIGEGWSWGGWYLIGILFR